MTGFPKGLVGPDTEQIHLMETDRGDKRPYYRRGERGKDRAIKGLRTTAKRLRNIADRLSDVGLEKIGGEVRTEAAIIEEGLFDFAYAPRPTSDETTHSLTDEGIEQ